MSSEKPTRLRRFVGRGRMWAVMAIVLAASAFFFDDFAQLMLSDTKPVQRQSRPVRPTNMTSTTPQDSDSRLLDSAFTRAVTDGDATLTADALMTETYSGNEQADEGSGSDVTIQDLLTSLDTSGSLIGRDALSAAVLLLETGRDRLSRQNSYAATFNRQESIAGELRDEERIEIKIRHVPFGVYMKWLTGDAGREAMYNAGERDGNMLIRLGGFKGRILPALKIDPYGTRAMKSSRHPITECGLLELSNLLVNFRRSDLAEDKLIDCELQSHSTCDNRDAYFMRLEYGDRRESDVYRRTDLHIDRELLLPVCIFNYTWPTDGVTTTEDDTLIEYYHFTDLVLNEDLPAIHFDSSNPAYRFGR